MTVVVLEVIANIESLPQCFCGWFPTAWYCQTVRVFCTHNLRDSSTMCSSATFGAPKQSCIGSLTASSGALSPKHTLGSMITHRTV